MRVSYGNEECGCKRSDPMIGSPVRREGVVDGEGKPRAELKVASLHLRG
jgi:hypothetical protein